MKILIAEDDELTRVGLAEIMDSEGYEVFQAANGEEALELYAAHQPDFICLDIMMPLQDGFSVCRQIRQKNPDTPIIFISAKGEEIDKVLGLELGADDFIVKPFGVREVIARIRAITRRYLATQTPSQNEVDEEVKPEFCLNELSVFPKQLRAKRGDETFDLSLRDTKILELFYLNPGRVLDRNLIFNKCWGLDYFPNSRTLDQHISKLRKRIEKNPKEPSIIKTVHGIGYRFDED
jgi:DNA-binding response OmpR family regulator